MPTYQSSHKRYRGEKSYCDQCEEDLLLPKRLLVVDVETTGLDPSADCLVQIASCMLSRKDLREEAHFVTYVRPDSPISAEAQAVHGLTETDLASAPSLDRAVRAFAEYAHSDAILCGHNVSFDVAFLRNAYRRVGLQYPFDYHTVDLWSIAFFILAAQRTSLPSYDLNALCSHYGIKRGSRHDALEDVRASADILRHLFADIKETLNVLG